MTGRTTNFTRGLAIAAFVGGIVISPSLYAAMPDSTMTSTDVSSSVEVPMMKRKIEHKQMPSEDRVEKRIKELHEKLKITENQSSAWNNVANTMRDSESNVHALIQERHEKIGTQNAVEDLVSYQRIAAAHAEKLGNFIQVFQPLYDSMSSEQKKNADTVFATYEGHSGRRGHIKNTK